MLCAIDAKSVFTKKSTNVDFALAPNNNLKKQTGFSYL
jgi:hypothetical protein